MKIWITVLCAVAMVVVGCAEKDPEPGSVAAKVVVDGGKIISRDALWYFDGVPFTGVGQRKYENGQKEYEATFQNGEQHGLETHWHRNGQKSSERTWKNGKLISEKEWVEDGNPLWQDQEEGDQKPETKDEAPKIVVDEDQLEYRDDLYYFKEKPFTGVAVSKHDNGQKESEWTYKDGKLHGLMTGWFEGGKKRWEKTYKDDKLISRKFWVEDGKPLGQDQEVDAPKPAVEAPKVVVDWDHLERRDGLWHFEEKPFTGVAVEKYKSGQKKVEGTYKDGKQHGLWTRWHENGQKYMEGTHKDGKANGMVTWWYENGQKSLEATYKDDEQISLKEWDRDGNRE
jgi:antitoxin component YwqK of YwqJK toxin-antitoxin module